MSADVDAAAAVSNRGITVLGLPWGTPQFQSAELMAIVQKERAFLLDRFVPLLSGHPQAAVLLLTKCVKPKFNHLLREIGRAHV